jgi:hypothetical protein
MSARTERAYLPNPIGWWAGSDEEYMNIGGPFDTREQAIEAGRADRCGEQFYILRAALESWAAPDASWVVDQFVEDNIDAFYEGDWPGFDGGEEAAKAAEADLQKVLNDWFERHKGILPPTTAFDGTSDGEWIDRPKAENVVELPQ